MNWFLFHILPLYCSLFTPIFTRLHLISSFYLQKSLTFSLATLDFFICHTTLLSSISIWYKCWFSMADYKTPNIFKGAKMPWNVDFCPSLAFAPLPISWHRCSYTTPLQRKVLCFFFQNVRATAFYFLERFKVRQRRRRCRRWLYFVRSDEVW